MARISIREWSLSGGIDYKRFRSWIRQKFGVADAHLFIGLMPRHAGLYTSLQNAGYKLAFKEVVYDGEGNAKGNCDADLVLKAARDHYEIGPTPAVLVSSDGDYAALVRFWLERGVQCTIVSPASVRKCSVLLKKTGGPIIYLDEVRHKLSTGTK